MTTECIQALIESIEKWELIVENPCLYDVSNITCPLCQYSKKQNTFKCLGCPIFRRLVSPGCHGTPFWHFYHAFVGERAEKELRRLAQKELDFLYTFLT